MSIEIIIAAATPNGDALKSFLEVVTYLVVLGAALKALLKKNPGHAELATKTEVKHLEVKVDSVMAAVRTEMKDDDEKIHVRMGAVSIKLATLDGKLDTVNANLNMLMQKEVGK